MNLSRASTRIWSGAVLMAVACSTASVWQLAASREAHLQAAEQLALSLSSAAAQRIAVSLRGMDVLLSETAEKVGDPNHLDAMQQATLRAKLDQNSAVVGMGVNVSLTREELPVPTATSLALEGFPLDQSAIVAGVLNHFARWYEAWTVRGNLRAEYVARCASIGADLAVHLDGEPPVLGVGRGVDRYGRLEVATPGGLRVFAVGDVVHARLHS